MSIKEVLKKQAEIVSPGKKTLSYIAGLTRKAVSALSKEIKKSRISAGVFIGGSFAKGTILKKDKYDVDLFVRFSRDDGGLSEILEKPVKNMGKALGLGIEKVHGSRDYFRLYNKEMAFEVVPVLKISRPSQEKNVTDLSYFHVSYVRKHARKLGDEIRLAKSFCHAQHVYGAESYIGGFSGYGLECLVIYYKSFEKMLRELARAKTDVKKKIVIDSSRHYKNKNEALIFISKSKLNSPIVLVDPTYKERNALAALSIETFEKFQRAAKAFLKRPSLDFFIDKKADYSEFKKRAKKSGADCALISIYTERQAGDIAGTKMRKFQRYMENEISKYFDIIDSEFHYAGGRRAQVYLAAKPKKEIIKIGPPSNMKEHAVAFRKANRSKSIFMKDGRLYSREKARFSVKSFVAILRKNRGKLNEMSVTKLGADN